MVNLKQVLVSWLCNQIVAVVCSKLNGECHLRHSKCRKSETIQKPCEREGFHQHTQVQSFFIICTEIGSVPCVCPCDGSKSRHNVKLIRNICDEAKVSHSGTHKYHFHSSNNTILEKPERNMNYSDKHLPSSDSYLSQRRKSATRYSGIIDNNTKNTINVINNDDRHTNDAGMSRPLTKGNQELSTEEKNIFVNDPQPVLGWAIALVAVLLVVLTVVVVVALY